MKKLFLFLFAVGTAVCAGAQAPADWANFGRFEQANRTENAPKIVMMGNSITELWNDKYPEFFAAHGCVSRGISGQTTSQMLVRFRSDVLNLHPQVVVLCGGTNDIAQNNGYISLQHIFENIVSMVELARANGITPVLCSLPPTRDFSWHKGLEPAPKIVEVNALIRCYAQKERIPYVDYHTAMAAPDGGMIAAYTYDGVHPTKEGYAVMEKVLEPVLEAAMKAKPKNRRR